MTAELLTGRTSKGRTGTEECRFAWAFEPGRFVLEGEALPTDLLEAMLGPGREANRIVGGWRIANQRITLSALPTEASTPERECSFPIYSTGVIRIETPAAQYVF